MTVIAILSGYVAARSRITALWGSSSVQQYNNSINTCEITRFVSTKLNVTITLYINSLYEWHRVMLY